MDFESFWKLNIPIGFVSGFILMFNNTNTNLWITAIEIIIILSIIITIIQLILARQQYETFTHQIFRNFFFNLWQIFIGSLFGALIAGFFTGYWKWR